MTLLSHIQLNSNYSDPDNIYMVPASDENSLYTQYKKMNIRHIPRNTVRYDVAQIHKSCELHITCMCTMQ